MLHFNRKRDLRRGQKIDRRFLITKSSNLSVPLIKNLYTQNTITNSSGGADTIITKQTALNNGLLIKQ